MKQTAPGSALVAQRRQPPISEPKVPVKASYGLEILFFNAMFLHELMELPTCNSGIFR